MIQWMITFWRLLSFSFFLLSFIFATHYTTAMDATESRTMKARRDGEPSILFSTIIRFNAFLRKAYKSKGGLKQDDLRRRREEQQVEIRRQKREENISKRRNFLPSAGNDSDEEIGTGTWDPPVDVSYRTFC